MTAAPDEPAPSSGGDQETGLRRLRTKIARHWYWGRTQGFGRLVEEDQLDPLLRLRTAVSKARWRARHGVPRGAATPVWLVGLQRSGTNMLVRGLETAPEFEVHNENDRAAFHHFRLRGDDRVAALVRRSRHRFVLFKPLCDSHRIDELLDGLDIPAAGRAIWAYRGVDGRVRSAVAKFGDANLDALRRISAGEGDSLWQAQRLSADSLDFIRGLDYSTLSAESAAAAFWYVRNRLLFEQGFAQRADLIVTSYDALVADPEPTMRALCAFLGIPYDPALAAAVERREGSGRTPLALDPVVRERCEDLGVLLDVSAQAARDRWGTVPGPTP